MPRVYQQHHTASLCRFAREVLHEVAPSGVQDALCQMPVPHHVGDAEVFQCDAVVLRDEPMRELLQAVLTGVGDALVLALKLKDGLAPVRAARLPAGDASLQHPQLPLRRPIPAGVWLLRALARGDETGDAYVYADRAPRLRQRCRLHRAGEAGIPLPGAARYANGLDLACQGAMPAHRHPPDPRQLQPPSVHFEPVPMLLEAKRVEAVTPPKAGIPRRFAGLHPPEERLERFVQISYNHLQDMAVDAFGGGVERLLLLHLRQLGELAHRHAALLVGIPALGKTLVVPAPAGFERAIKQPRLRLARIQAIDEGLHHRGGQCALRTFIIVLSIAPGEHMSKKFLLDLPETEHHARTIAAAQAHHSMQQCVRDALAEQIRREHASASLHAPHADRNAADGPAEARDKPA